MSQNLHQFFQITDMISRLERQFFLPRYIIKHLVHTHSFGSCHIILPTIAYHQRITHLGLCGRKCKMKDFGPGLQDTDVIRENNLLKKSGRYLPNASYDIAVLGNHWKGYRGYISPPNIPAPHKHAASADFLWE